MTIIRVSRVAVLLTAVGVGGGGCTLLTDFGDATSNSEVRVDDGVGSGVRSPAVAMAADGRFVVVWVQELAGGGSGIRARRYDADGTGGDVIQVDTSTTSVERPHVAMDVDGSFVVVWEDLSESPSPGGIYGRRFNAQGQAPEPDFQVDITHTFQLWSPRVAMAQAIGFVVAWKEEEDIDSPDDAGIWLRRFGLDGEPLSMNLTAHTPFVTACGELDIALNATNGDILVVFSEAPAGQQDYEIMGAWFSDYENQYSVLQLSEGHSDAQINPRVAMQSQGRAVVVWSNTDNTVGGVYTMRLVGNAGLPSGPEILLQTDAPGSRSELDVSWDSAGDFWLAYACDDDSYAGVCARRFDYAGAPGGDVRRVNSSMVGLQRLGGVGGDADGRLAVVWTSEDMFDELPPEDQGVYLRRFNSAGVPLGTP